MTWVAFTAPEYQADGAVLDAPYAFEGDVAEGWTVVRAGRPHLRLGPGYRLLRTARAGVCATDLARRHLPFPLPQVIGHEVLAHDEDGRMVVVEINASHRARGVASDCALCADGLPSHCPERLVLGIHGLPGGFGPWILAPRDAVLPVPDTITAPAATFAEPFAAALHAALLVTRRPRTRIAVLGPRRLGTLVVAALATLRARRSAPYEIVALARRPELRALARTLGADDARDPDHVQAPVADVVIDTTGSPAGFVQALALASAEVHLKSTCGVPAAGLARATAMVVDELALCGWRDDVTGPFPDPPLRTATLLPGVPATIGAALAARGLRCVDVGAASGERHGGVDLVVAGSLAEIDRAVRPTSGSERGIVRPRGVVALVPNDVPSPLGAALLERGIVVTTSRCGDLRMALDLLPSIAPELDRLVSDEIPSTRLAAALARAAEPDARKVIVTHER